VIARLGQNVKMCLRQRKQAAVRLVGEAHRQQRVAPPLEVTELEAELLGVDRIALVARRQCILEDPP